MLILILLSGATLCAALYMNILRQKLKKAEQKTHRRLIKPLGAHATQRPCEVGIIIATQLPEAQQVIEEFTNVMRNEGTRTYHFTYYKIPVNAENISKHLEPILNNGHDGLFVPSSAALFALKEISKNRTDRIPTVFCCPNATLWQEAQDKYFSDHMVGVTSPSWWKYRIPTFVNIKPRMRSVLIPFLETPNHSITNVMAVQEVIELCAERGIACHVIRAHTIPDLLNEIRKTAPQADSLIMTRFSIDRASRRTIAQICSEHEVTYFSSIAQDTYCGAAVAACSDQEHIGSKCAHKMLAILEKDKSPCQISCTPIDRTHADYVVYFNRPAMKSQELDPEIITLFALQRADRVTITDEEE